mgnify:CR=1 FL=1
MDNYGIFFGVFRFCEIKFKICATFSYLIGSNFVMFSKRNTLLF